MSSSPLLTSDAEFRVFIGPIDQVGWAPACSGVTASRSAAAQPRNGPPEAVSTSLATSSARAAAQALGQRGVLGVDGHDLAGLRRPQHQRTAGDQRFLVGQRQPGARCQRGQRRSQAQRADQRIEDDVGLGLLDQPGDRVGPAGRGRRRAACAARSSATAILVTPVSARCRSSVSRLAPPAASPTTSKRSGLAAMTSSAWVPIEPVLPSTRVGDGRSVGHLLIVPRRRRCEHGACCAADRRCARMSWQPIRSEESPWPVPRWSTTAASTSPRCRRQRGAGAESTTAPGTSSGC